MSLIDDVLPRYDVTIRTWPGPAKAKGPIPPPGRHGVPAAPRTATLVRRR